MVPSGDESRLRLRDSSGLRPPGSCRWVVSPSAPCLMCREFGQCTRRGGAPFCVWARQGCPTDSPSRVNREATFPWCGDHALGRPPGGGVTWVRAQHSACRRASPEGGGCPPEITPWRASSPAAGRILGCAARRGAAWHARPRGPTSAGARTPHGQPKCVQAGAGGEAQLPQIPVYRWSRPRAAGCGSASAVEAASENADRLHARPRDARTHRSADPGFTPHHAAANAPAPGVLESHCDGFPR
jgi:hypothetical protein